MSRRDDIVKELEDEYGVRLDDNFDPSPDGLCYDTSCGNENCSCWTNFALAVRYALAKKKGEGVYHEDLVCGLLSAQLLSPTLVLLRLPANHSEDMAGAIRVAQFLNPDVWTVVVFAGQKWISKYVKVYGEWVKRK